MPRQMQKDMQAVSPEDKSSTTASLMRIVSAQTSDIRPFYTQQRTRSGAKEAPEAPSRLGMGTQPKREHQLNENSEDGGKPPHP